MDVGWNSIAISLGRKRVEGENSREEIYTIKLCTGGGDVLIERTFELQLLLNSSSKIFLFLFPVYLKEACDLDNLDLRGKRFLFSLSISLDYSSILRKKPRIPRLLSLVRRFSILFSSS